METNRLKDERIKFNGSFGMEHDIILYLYLNVFIGKRDHYYLKNVIKLLTSNIQALVMLMSDDDGDSDDDERSYEFEW